MTTKSHPLTGSCHCGAVTITLPHPPEYITECNCTLCTKIAGLWGYFAPVEMQISDAPTIAYVRADLAEVFLRTHSCATCGCTTHWSGIDPAMQRMGVNMLLFEPDDITGIEIRKADGRSW